MTVDPYVGSAGGQPRLLLPNMRGFGKKMDQNLRTLYTWANSLLMGGGGGGILGYAEYGNSSPLSNATDVNWTTTGPHNFAYLTTATQMTAVPADSITAIFFGVTLAPSAPSGVSTRVLGELQMEDSASGVISRSVFEQDTGTLPNSIGFSMGNNPVVLFDSAAPPGAGFPYTWLASLDGGIHPGASLSFLSWTKP